MNKNTTMIYILGMAFFTIGILTFIYFNNDHAECENIVEYSVGQNGEQVETEKHICKERFRF